MSPPRALGFDGLGGACVEVNGQIFSLVLTSYMSTEQTSVAADGDALTHLAELGWMSWSVVVSQLRMECTFAFNTID